VKHSDFAIGQTFWCGGRQWRCTDLGTRTVVAICVDSLTLPHASTGLSRTLNGAEAEAEGWFNGPPYAVAETVFDEDSQEACEQTNEAAA